MKYIAAKSLTILEALREMFPEASNTSLRSWIKEGRITVDGIERKSASHVIEVGETVKFGSKKKFIGGEIQILFEDSDVIVIDKPEGLLSVSTAFQKEQTAHSFLKNYLRPKMVYPVHRLDQDTSGVMVFAISEKARMELKKLFELHDIEREYSALVEGNMEESSGTWKSYLYEDEGYVVHETDNPKQGKESITHYELVGTSKKFSWLKLILETGRKNQIRVHCKSSGHPIAGDKKYGASSNPLKRLCLHARVLGFIHPVTGKKMVFESPVPQSFYKLIKPIYSS